DILDELSRDLDLDFFVLFSSLSGAFGNAGQAGYAAANGYLDGYARRRNAQVAAGMRRGRTISINWPLWRDGGMRLDAANAARVREHFGLAAIDAADGWRALDQALEGDASQVLVLGGDAAKLRATFLARLAPDDITVGAARGLATPVATDTI